MVFPARLLQACGACRGALRLPGRLGGWGEHVRRLHGSAGRGCVAAPMAAVAGVSCGGRARECR